MQNYNLKFKVNRKFLLISFLIIISLGIYGYFKAVPVPQSQKNLPRIETIPKFFDFGEVEYGKVLEYIFVVENKGEKNLKIKRVATSCACTTAKIEKKSLDPGEKTKLLVKYNTGAMSGPHGKGKQERTIFIQSNDPNNPQVEVVIYAFVK